MTKQTAALLGAFLLREREVLLANWRTQVRQLPSARRLDVPTLNDHLPKLINELATALAEGSDESIPKALEARSSLAHGQQRVQDAFDIEEIVAEYNILRECIHDLANEHGLFMQGMPFHIVNRVLDGAIGLAVQSYASERAAEVQRKREEYLAFVAHDLRTPLNAISLAARVLEFMLPDAEPASDMSQMFNALRRGVQQLEGLVSKVLEENVNLETESGITLERRNFDLWPLVEALIHDLHPVAGTSSTRLINSVPNELVVYADASLLRRVFQNLIANAIKYTPHGAITIGARELPEEKLVECWVADNGSGIPPELLDRVFEKGETDPDSTGGMGLGLAIVQTFTEAHGGTVSVRSTEGLGSEFRFTLPMRSAG